MVEVRGEPAGIGGGFLAGYNHQFGNVVVGMEGDFTVSDAGDSPDFTAITAEVSANEFYSLRGRLGYAMEDTLFYVTAGPAWAHVDYSWLSEIFRDSATFFGYEVGGGLEYALSESLSLRTEYLYADYGKESIVLSAIPVNQNLETHTVRAAIVWNFASLFGAVRP